MSSIPESDPVMNCAGCGASIYQEHIDHHLARLHAGSMYCQHCLAEKQSGATDAQGDLERIEVADEPASGDRAMRSSVAGFTGLGISAGGFADQNLQRPLNPAGRGATRVRIFHCKLSHGPVAHLNQQINDWLDQNAEIEVKFANTTVGVWEGKHAEPNLIVAIFY